MTAIYRPLGSVLSFPIDFRNMPGQLADPDASSILLFSDEEPQPVEGVSVSMRKVADGLFFADAASSNATLQSLGFYANERRIRAAARNVTVGEETGFGGFLPYVYIIGTAPGSTGSGSRIVTLTVQDADEIPILGVTVTAYDANGRFAGMGTSDVSGLIVLHLMPGEYDLSSPTIPGGWGMANPMQSITVAADGPNAFEVEFLAMPITPPEAGRATGWLVTLGMDQQPIAGAKVNIVAVTPPVEGLNSDTGLWPPDTPWEKTSPSGGLVEYPGLLVGWEYQIWGEGLGFDGVGYFIVPLSALNDPNGFPITQNVRKAA